MKAKILFLSFAFIAMLLCSCDDKPCKCYTYNGATVYSETKYVGYSSSCSALDYSQGNNYRVCLEYDEADIDPDDIGQEYKKK